MQRTNFNPLPRKEGDRRYHFIQRNNMDFNPLPRKEGDHRSQRVPCPVGDFNPLPRKEGDYCPDVLMGCHVISIHSLVKRETSPNIQLYILTPFQSTPS